MKRLLNHALREPLVHFLLLGAALFGVYALFGNQTNSPAGQIVVTRGQVEQLVVGFARTWQRPPSERELKGLIEDSIREEVLYREAMAMGLDRDDTIVRRRLRQKLEFLTEDLASQSAPPAERELQAYLDQHADKYREEPKVTFQHIFFNPERRGKAADAEARAVLAQLNRKNGRTLDPESLGDSFLLPFHYTLAPIGEVSRLFGGDFGQRVAEVEPKRWAGPIESSYGLHLVLVRERVPGRVPELARVRDAVLRDLLSERRQQALEAAYAKLRQRYTVVVEEPALQVAEAR